MVCLQTMIGNASFYKWRAKYGGMDASLISQMKAMEEENWTCRGFVPVF